MSSNNEIPDTATLKLLKCVFPNGLLEREYLPLLHILRKDMTIRATSSLVGILLSKEYKDVYNDALGVNSDSHKLDKSIVRDLELRFQECGYNLWLES